MACDKKWEVVDIEETGDDVGSRQAIARARRASVQKDRCSDCSLSWRRPGDSRGLMGTDPSGGVVVVGVRQAKLGMDY